MSGAPAFGVSVIVPVFDEEDNVGLLHREIRQALESTGRTWEAIYVDDGSRDGSLRRLRRLAAEDEHVEVIRLRRNCGQTAALQAGIDQARGAIVVTLDADLQNDPADIPRMLAAVQAGSDVVCGWRRDRQDKLVSRRLPSIAANWLIGALTGVPIHDNGCTLKAYRAEVIKQARLYAEMHRFLAPMLSVSGCRYTEMVVHHRPRRFGRSKYGLSRIWKVFLDLLTVKMLLRFVSHPAAWFALLGAPFLVASGAALAGWAWTLAGGGAREPSMVLPAVAVLCGFAGVHLLLSGMAAELVVRVGDYREAQPILAHRSVTKGTPS